MILRKGQLYKTIRLVELTDKDLQPGTYVIFLGNEIVNHDNGYKHNVDMNIMFLVDGKIVKYNCLQTKKDFKSDILVLTNDYFEEIY